MKAFIAERYGGPEVMHLGEMPDPVARKGSVVVSVRTSSINPVDWKIRAGKLRLLSGFRFPRALGTDYAGVIHSVGPGVTGWNVGDEVYGLSVTALGRPGAHAERVVIPAGDLRRKPPDLGFDIAATLPVAGLTALNCLRLCGDLAGKHVLVNGASGGVGHMAVQIAVARGARVTAVCGTANTAFVSGLGATEVIDYKIRDFTKDGVTFDAVVDAYGFLGFGKARPALAAKGVYVTTMGLPDVFLLGLYRRLVGGPQLRIGNVRTQPSDYADIEALVRTGALRPVVTQSYPLARAAEAFAASEAGGVPGKIILTI